MTEPAGLPELFDLDFGDFDADLALYQDLALRTTGSVLDLGSGTGRVALPLARAGYDVYGIEQSEAMISYAMCKAGDALRERLHLACGDIRDFKLGREFDLVFAAYGTFHHLLTQDDQLACLRSVRLHLSANGVFVCDQSPLLQAIWDPAEATPLLHDWTTVREETGDVVTKLRAVRPDRASQVQHEVHFYERVSPDGTMRRTVNEMDLRFTSRFEMEALLRLAGLELEGMYGDYDLTPYNDASEYMITIARRGKDTA